MATKKRVATLWMDGEIMEILRKLRQEKGIIISRFVESAILEKLQREGFVKTEKGKEVIADA
jgi:hypothetical protein